MSEENNRKELSAGYTAVSKIKEMAESLHAQTPEDDHKLTITAGFTLAEELMKKGELNAANTIYLSLSGSMKQTISQMAEAKKQEALTKVHPLTGMPNRLALIEHLMETVQNMNRDHFNDKDTSSPAVKDSISGAMHSAATNKASPVVIFVDLEHFKSVNDDYDSSVGDKLLCAVGKNLEYHKRPKDHVFHLAGDEFVIVIDNIDAVTKLPEHDNKMTALDVVLERTQNTVSRSQVTSDDGDNISRRAHIGFKTIELGDINTDMSPAKYVTTLIAAADKNRLEKKRTPSEEQKLAPN